jgi:hypothetical protein
VVLTAAVTGLVLLAGAASVPLILHRHPSWHPGDDIPEVPADAPLRTWHS